MLAACAHVDPYPGDWADLPAEQPATCSFPAGFFANRMDDRPEAATLSSHLGLDGRAQQVRFMTDAQGMQSIAAIRYGEVIGEHQLDDERSKPQCERGWLVFEDGIEWLTNPAGWGWQGEALGLMLVDEHLVLRRSDSFVGMGYILPVAGYGRSWYRFRHLGELDLEQLKQQALEQNKRAFPR
jgi:hypothetical protein